MPNTIEIMQDFVLKLHVWVSLYLFGLIWFVQIVHYPLFQKVPANHFVRYEQTHTRRTSWITAPVMLVELATAILLMYFHQNTFFGLNLLGVAALWLSTFFVQVPLHNRLLKSYHPAAIKKLVQTNWIRTLIWTIRAIVLIFFV